MAEESATFDPQVGDGVTIYYCTAFVAATVVRRTPKRVHVIEDRLIRHDDGRTRFDSEEDFERDPGGARYVFSLRADDTWVLVGDRRTWIGAGRRYCSDAFR